MKLNNVFINWADEGAIFAQLNRVFPWATVSNDFEYFGNRSGQKEISPLVENILIKYKTSTINYGSDAMKKLSDIVNSRYHSKWGKLSAAVSAEYDLLSMSEKIEETHADIITFGFRVDNNGDTSAVYIDPLPENHVFTLESLPELLLALPNAWTRIYKRTLFMETGIRYPGRVWYEDIRTTTKLFAKAGSIAAIHQPYYYYVVRENSITRNKNVARNHEIIDAFDDLLGWYKQNGLFERYREQLCRLAIDHIFLAASVRVLMTDPKHPLLKEFNQYLYRYFPHFETNRYLADLPKSKKLAFRLLLKKRYRTLRMLFLAKDKLGK